MIPIQVDTDSNPISPLLHEICHALNNLLHHNQTTCIDLQNLPLSRDDKQRLFDILGQGEIKAELAVLGHSVIWETAYSGVWCIEHYHTEGMLISHTLEITWYPTILQSQKEDVQAGYQRLTQRLSL